MWEETFIDVHRVYLAQFAPRPILDKLYSCLETIVSELVGYSVVILRIDPGNFINGTRIKHTNSLTEGPHILRAKTTKHQVRHMDGWCSFISMALHMGCSNTTKVATEVVESLTSRLHKVLCKKMTSEELVEEIKKELESASFDNEDLLCFLGDFTIFVADQEIHYGVKTPTDYICPQTGSSHRHMLYIQFVRKSTLKHIKHPFFSSEYQVTQDVEPHTVDTNVEHLRSLLEKTVLTAL
jgi:hypothetical protein